MSVLWYACGWMGAEIGDPEQDWGCSFQCGRGSSFLGASEWRMRRGSVCQLWSFCLFVAESLGVCLCVCVSLCSEPLWGHGRGSYW